VTEAILTGAAGPNSEDDLDEYLSRPTANTAENLRGLRGDLLVLGAGGKMGLNICTMARRGFDSIGEKGRKVTAVSRFGDPAIVEQFKRIGIEIVSANLLDNEALDRLPDSPEVLFLAGAKFGSSDNLSGTWAVNTFLPGLVGRRFAKSRIVAVSTGNVYSLSLVARGGSTESDSPQPIGEYAQSCLGRERILSYYSVQNGAPVCLVRLNYSNALRYGVVTDIACKVQARQSIDLTMGFVNVIWQGDANAAILGAFSLSASPPCVLNVTGPETASVRWIATTLAELLGSDPPQFVNSESDTALLSNASRCHGKFGYPSVPLHQLLAWTANWVQRGGRLLQKPTGFQVRDGRF
jgi:nucleoside-diphosphate-sugar epimerase